MQSRMRRRSTSSAAFESGTCTCSKSHLHCYLGQPTASVPPKRAMSMPGLLAGGLKLCRERARVGFQVGWAIMCVHAHAPNRICTSDAFGRDRRHRHSTRNAFSAPITTCGGNVRAVCEYTQVKTCSECLLARAVLSSRAARSFQAHPRLCSELPSWWIDRIFRSQP
jgi:hypothetical protein